jgi:hypothetical protein
MKGDKAARKRANDRLNTDLGRCMIAKRDAGVSALADQRAAKRIGGS